MAIKDDISLTPSHITIIRLLFHVLQKGLHSYNKQLSINSFLESRQILMRQSQLVESQLVD